MGAIKNIHIILNIFFSLPKYIYYIVKSYLFSSFLRGLELSSISITSTCCNLLYKDWYAFPCGNINNIPYNVLTKYLYFLGCNKYILISKTKINDTLT